MWNKNGTWCASFGNLPVLESRLCHFLVIWPWTSHITSQYWPQESGEKTWREHLSGMLTGLVMLWTGQSPPRQRAVITTTECKSHVIPSRKPLITLIDEVTTTAVPKRKKKDSSPFLARTQAMKSHGLCKSPPNLLFPSVKMLSSPGTLGTYTWLSTNADLKLPFSDDSE